MLSLLFIECSSAIELVLLRVSGLVAARQPAQFALELIVSLSIRVSPDTLYIDIASMSSHSRGVYSCLVYSRLALSNT